MCGRLLFSAFWAIVCKGLYRGSYRQLHHEHIREGPVTHSNPQMLVDQILRGCISHLKQYLSMLVISLFVMLRSIQFLSDQRPTHVHSYMPDAWKFVG